MESDSVGEVAGNTLPHAPEGPVGSVWTSDLSIGSSLGEPALLPLKFCRAVWLGAEDSQLSQGCRDRGCVEQVGHSKETEFGSISKRKGAAF